MVRHTVGALVGRFGGIGSPLAPPSDHVPRNLYLFGESNEYPLPRPIQDEHTNMVEL